MSRLNYSTTTAARSRVVKVWIALRNNPGEKDLRDVASCGQGDILIGREMHGDERKARLDFFTIRCYFSTLSQSLQ